MCIFLIKKDLSQLLGLKNQLFLNKKSCSVSRIFYFYYFQVSKAIHNLAEIRESNCITVFDVKDTFFKNKKARFCNPALNVFTTE